MGNLKISRKAYELICRESMNHDTETGGLLLGTLKTPVVIEASSAGMNSNTTAISYTNDSSHDNEVVREMIQKYRGKCKLIGYWHKHPYGCNHPSAGDLQEAKNIIETNARDGDTRSVFFIITNVNKQVDLYSYRLKPGINSFQHVELEEVDDQNFIDNALKHESLVIQPQVKDFWRGDFRFYETHYGFDRLKQEVDILLKSGYKVKVYTDEQLFLRIEKEGLLYCYLPPEYPLNPPRIFKNNVEIKYCMPIWNSTFMIVDILENINKRKQVLRRIYGSRNNKTNVRQYGLFERLKTTIRSVWDNTRK